MNAAKTYKAINNFIESTQETEHRKHLGASIIGGRCGRKIFYTFRWVKKEFFEGRMIRLFNRGHLEEFRFTEWLKGIGCEVWDCDPQTSRQFTISDCNGHFGGSLDGVAKGVPDVPDGLPCLTEYKTHSNKSFENLVKLGMLESKPEHHVQMLIYMMKYQFKYGLYFAINKNNDEIYLEIVTANDNLAYQYITRAGQIINAVEPPAKISESPTFWECKYCNYTDICHDREIPEINCRTCAYASPVENKKWQCSKGQDGVDKNCKACEHHLFNPHLINMRHWVEGSDVVLEDGDYFTKYGTGEGSLSSEQLREKFNC